MSLHQQTNFEHQYHGIYQRPCPHIHGYFGKCRFKCILYTRKQHFDYMKIVLLPQLTPVFNSVFKIWDFVSQRQRDDHYFHFYVRLCAVVVCWHLVVQHFFTVSFFLCIFMWIEIFLLNNLTFNKVMCTCEWDHGFNNVHDVEEQQQTLVFR